MKTRIINGLSKMKSNFDFGDYILQSPNHKLSHINQLKVTAEISGDSEIIFNAVIPFDGKLVVTRAGEKNGLPLISVNVTGGLFMNAIPVSMHDETDELECVLSSGNKTQIIKVELVHSDIHI
ncbi:hypothetical protein LBMAG27_23950 [Bacteroidota bacterium]|nr:hypothetical protein LBMAG27_23950 [Bacteroidota bacterium]